MKTYVKPELYYEDFMLSEHVASCGILPDSANYNTINCTSIISAGITIFTEETCGIPDNIVEICYTTGSNNGYFAS